MFNKELCVDCPKRDDLTFGKTRKLISRLALGKNYSSPNCETGAPYVAGRETYVTRNLALTSETLGCGSDGIGETTVSTYSDGVLISMKRGDRQLVPELDDQGLEVASAPSLEA